MPIDLDQLSSTRVPYQIYCADGEYLIGRKNREIMLSDCYGNPIESSFYPLEDDHYEYTQTDNYWVFVFSSRVVMLVDKANKSFEFTSLEPDKIGRSVTPLFSINDDIIFGTTAMKRSQFVRYRLPSFSRVCQTSSWDLDSISDLICVGTKLYGVLNRSMIIHADMDSGKTLFTKFESASIGNRITPFKKGVAYPIQGLITLLNHPTARRIQIPGMSATSLEYMDEHSGKMFFVSKTLSGSQQLGCYNIYSAELEWSIPTAFNVIDTLFLTCTVDSKPLNVWAILMEGHIAFVNPENQAIIRTEKCENATSMRLTGSNLVIKRTTGSTVIKGS